MINKKINYSLKTYWLNATNIALNVSKTGLVMFSPPKKQLIHELKIQLNGKMLYQID